MPELKDFKNKNGKPVSKTCYGLRLSDTWASELVTKSVESIVNQNDAVILEIRKKIGEIETLLTKIK